MADIENIRAKKYENNKETEPADECPACDSTDICPFDRDLSGGEMFCNECGEIW